MIKLFITDLDGTLLYRKVRDVDPNERCKKAIAHLEQQGVQIAIATGRYDSDIQVVENYLQLKKKGYRIGMNGGTIYSPSNVKIRELLLEENDARAIFDYVDSKLRRQTSFLVTCTSDEERFFHKIGYLFNPMLWFFWKTRAEKINSTSVEQFITSDRTFYKILVSASKYNTDFIDLKLQNNFNGFEVFKTSPYSVEVCPKGANKGTAIEYIMKIEGLRPDEVAFIGDSGNDIPALKVVKHSFVMDHADHYVQEHARYVVSDVAEAIDMILRYNDDLCCRLPQQICPDNEKCDENVKQSMYETQQIHLKRHKQIHHTQSYSVSRQRKRVDR